MNGRSRVVAFALLLVTLFINVQSRLSGQSLTVDSLQKALQQTQSDTEKVNILIQLAHVQDCEHVANKITYAHSALDLAEKTKWVDGRLKATIFLGDVFYGWCINDRKKALSFYLKADTLAAAEQRHYYKIVCLRNIAAVYQRLGEYKQAIDYYRLILQSDVTYDEEMVTWGNLGVAYNSIGDYNQALSSYYNALRLFSRKTNDIDDSVEMAGLLLNIGDVNMEMGRPEKAFGNYDSVYKLGLITQYKVLEVIGLMGMGEVYLVKKDYTKAIAYFQTAAASNAGLNDYKNEIKILVKLATAHMGKGALPEAMEFAQRSLKLAEEKANNEQLPKIYITLGKVYEQQHDYANAISYLQKALDIAQRTAALDDEKDAWFALSNTYEQMNDPAKALTAYKQFIGIRDSVYNIAKANEITRQELDFYYKDKQTELDRKISQQQTFTYLGIAGLILLVLLSFFIYRNYNTQRKYNKLLSKEKERHLQHIEAQDTVLSDIAHMQSHNVRGPVATILGLVKLFNKENVSDPVNKDIIDGLEEVTEKLDVAVKEVIIKENRHKSEQGNKK